MDKKLFCLSSIDGIFDTEKGAELFLKVRCVIKEHSMEQKLDGGVLLGFSGGADSVLLALVLKRLAEEGGFPLAALHVNHGIRGDEADRDEKFSKDFCEKLGIPFKSVRVDVPTLAKEQRLGLEDAARRVRYSAFNNFLKENCEFTSIATAHNATDNAETVLFNLFRGSGPLGACGIAPVRENIIRPLITLSKSTIVEFLSENKIPFMTDSTNSCNDYSRNYIRNNILPLIKAADFDIESSVIKFTSAMREENSFVECIAEDFFAKNNLEGKISSELLSAQKDAMISSVVRYMAKDFGVSSLEFVHIKKIRELLKRGGDFYCDTPEFSTFICEGGYCFFQKKSSLRVREKFTVRYELQHGVNYLEELGKALLLSYDKNEIFSSNVYKFSMKVKVPFDIIDDSLYVRRKEAGDSYRYGGMTRKLKKLFCEKGIPKSERGDVPVICDSEGILWVPGFGVRDNTGVECDKPIYISLYEKL